MIAVILCVALALITLAPWAFVGLLVLGILSAATGAKR